MFWIFKKNMPPEKLNGYMYDAAGTGSIWRMKYFLKKGADINARNINGVTTLMTAAHANREKSVRFLLKNGADAKLVGADSTALSWAITKKNPEVVRMLIEAGSDINHVDKSSNNTPLLDAVSWSFKEAVLMLLKAGADTTIQSVNGATVLDRAISLARPQQNIEIVRLLIENGVDVNLQNNRGGTALRAAIATYYYEAIEYLFSKGADPFLKDTKGISPTDLAHRQFNGHFFWPTFEKHVNAWIEKKKEKELEEIKVKEAFETAVEKSPYLQQDMPIVNALPRKQIRKNNKEP